jgi:DNA-binding CsgD family transcriptional regulator
MEGAFFGRNAELLSIGSFLGRLAQGPAALVLAGPAGAGKTTLLRAGSTQAADQGYTRLETRPARSDLRLAFAGLADLLEPCLQVLDELPAPQARALRVALLLEDSPPQPPEPRVIAAAFRSVLRTLARSAPVLLVVDDIQWLDPASGAAIGFAVRRLEDERAGLLCAQRTTREDDELPLELGHARQAVSVVRPAGLGASALHRMLRSRLGTSFPQPTLRRIEAESAGNPFIALEIGRALVRRGVHSVGTSILPVPGTLAGLVGERLGTLSAAVLDAVRLVAVRPGAPIGDYLSAGVGGPELDAAVAAGVLDPDGGRLRFAHPLLAAAVAEATPPARRAELHAIAAGIARLPEERARHQALAAAGPSAPVAAELDEAAQAAAGRGSPATAADLFGLAATMTPDESPADAGRRRLAAARQLALAGETRAARTALEDLVDSMPSGPGRCDVLSQLGLLREDDLTAAMDLQQQALAQAAGDPARAADIHMIMSDIALAQGDQELAFAKARQALAQAERAGDTELLAATLAQAYCYGFIVGADVDDAWLKRALELERTTSGGLLRTQPSFVAGFCHMSLGRLEEAEAELRYFLSRAEADGIEYSRADALLRLSLLAVRRGDADTAASLAAEGLDIAEQIDLPQLTTALLYGCARAALHRGQADQVRELAARGAELARRSGDRPYSISHQALLGSLELALGDHHAAVASFRPLIGSWQEMGARLFVNQGSACDAVEALIVAGELDEARALFGAAEPLASEPTAAAAMLRCQALLSAALGDLETAEQQLTEALGLLAQVSLQPLERGRTLLALGGVQRRRKQRAAARATLLAAKATFDQVGAPLWAGRARAELSRISGRAAGPAELTAAESRVAELVAQGRSNREVAAELCVTVRTVESTLTKAYAKLGIRSRTELAAHMLRSR